MQVAESTILFLIIEFRTFFCLWKVGCDRRSDGHDPNKLLRPLYNQGKFIYDPPLYTSSLHATEFGHISF